MMKTRTPGAPFGPGIMRSTCAGVASGGTCGITEPGARMRARPFAVHSTGGPDCICFSNACKGSRNSGSTSVIGSTAVALRPASAASAMGRAPARTITVAPLAQANWRRVRFIVSLLISDSGCDAHRIPRGVGTATPCHNCRTALPEASASLGLEEVSRSSRSRVMTGRVAAFLVIAVLITALAYGAYLHPPLANVRRGELLVRMNVLDASVMAYSSGTVLVLPGVHEVRRYPIRDQVYRPTDSASATGPAPFQSNEGLSIGVDLTVRWAIDRTRIAQMSKDFPDDLNNDLVRPAVQGIVYPLFARYSVREIFSGRRAEIQQEITKELRPKLAARGLLLRGVDMGQVDLPPDYRAGME